VREVQAGSKEEVESVRSCGEVTVYPGGIGLALRATCENGIIVDTFAKGFACPFHDDESGAVSGDEGFSGGSDDI
jgi:hypothetical protein